MSPTFRITEIIVRGGDLIGYGVVKPTGGEEAAFMLSRHGSAPVAKRFVQNLCNRLNGDDGWDEATNA